MKHSIRCLAATIVTNALTMATTPETMEAQVAEIPCCCTACSSVSGNDFCFANDVPVDEFGLCFIVCAYSGCYGLAITTTDCVEDTEYDPGTACGTRSAFCSLLPVELSRLNATVVGRQVVISWSTSSETDNLGFDVEQEVGSGAFRSIGFVNGRGTTTDPQEYSYTVSDLSPGHYVFRLKQIDFDGVFDYSQTVEVTVTVPDDYVLEAAYPNPFNPSTTIRFAVATEQPVTLTLVDSGGREVRTLYEGVVTQNETMTVRVEGEGLATGVYVVRLVGERFVATESVTLVK